MRNNAEKLEDFEVIIDEPSIKMTKSLSEKTKKNFDTLMQPCGVLEADFALKNQFSEYSKSQLQTITNRIKQCVYNITSNFVEIGFRLWECEHYRYYTELGFDNVCEYAAAELGFKKSSTRNFIRVYDRFCNHKIVQSAANNTALGRIQVTHIPGNYSLLSEYKNFSYSQLTELLSLSDEQIEVIKPTPKDTVKQIRDKKREFQEAKEKWLHDTIIDVVCGKLGFKRQIYEFYCDEKDVGKLASLIGEHMREVRKQERCIIVDDGSCTVELSSLTLFHRVYGSENYRYYDVAEIIVKYIEQETFIEEQIHIDEIAEELAEEMLVTAPEPQTLGADEQRPYEILLYKQDIDIILKSLKAANVPQDDYERIYETIGKAEML